MSWLSAIIIVLATQLQLSLPSTLQNTLSTALEGKSATKTAQLPALDFGLTPIKSDPSATGPAIQTAAAIAIDRDTARPLYAFRADQARPIASITKLATALVIIRDHPLDEKVTIPKLPTYGSDDEIIGLSAGEQMMIGDLLAALLVQSANDAADSLAILDSGNNAAFAIKMNRLMAEWGIENAHFSNPSGLVDVGNTASARAVAQMGSLILHNPRVAQLINTQSMTIRDSAGRAFALTNTNNLLQTGRFYGIKTGYTAAAGQCFVGIATINGHQVITVVLDAHDRFGDTTTLADWIGANYTWQ